MQVETLQPEGMLIAVEVETAVEEVVDSSVEEIEMLDRGSNVCGKAGDGSGLSLGLGLGSDGRDNARSRLTSLRRGQDIYIAILGISLRKPQRTQRLQQSQQAQSKSHLWPTQVKSVTAAMG